jgi:nitroreductase
MADKVGKESGMSVDTTVLAAAARAAGHAPSIHNTQPWRWRVGRTLDLYADRGRQLAVTDPEGRLLTLSCGAALHHAVVALAAEGWRADVVRLPDAAEPNLLARIGAAEPIAVEPSAIRLLQTRSLRHTDRRPVTDREVDPAAVVKVELAVHTAGAALHRLDREQVIDLAGAAAHAQAVESLDPGDHLGVNRRTSEGPPVGAAHGHGLEQSHGRRFNRGRRDQRDAGQQIGIPVVG